MPWLVLLSTTGKEAVLPTILSDGVTCPPMMPRPNRRASVRRMVISKATAIHPHLPQRNYPLSLSLYLRGFSLAPEAMVISNAPAAAFFSLFSSTSPDEKASLSWVL